ncbi:MAG: sodium:solute symporter family protein [Candidatus Marinimicrobia bacterium]|nr:sodium:solute symporter family protein [Candidatus Neomarinimicrobiota bacterium]
MAILDWGIVGGYLLLSLGVGLYFTRRASSSLDDYFVAGRSLPWWLAGTSIVATTFSSDTPLMVAGMVRDSGIYENWFWWSAAFGSLISVYFFSKLWKRSGVRTDIEFIALRYEGKGAVYLRYFLALYKGIFFNMFILTSVTLAVGKLFGVILHLSPEPLITLPILGPITPSLALIVGLATMTFFYTILSGLYGVVYTDLLQFVLAMVGAISLAWLAWADAASTGVSVVERLSASPGFRPEMLNFFPSFENFDLKVLTFVVYLGVLWWGMAPGYAYQIQRLLACKTEKDALLANLWYSVLHYAVRSWPWIIVGVLSVIYFPDLVDSEKAYPMMIDKFMPVGLKGIMIASLLAAYMSTINTLLNWGSSYVINDFIRPRNPELTEKKAIFYGRVTGGLLAVLMLFFVTRLNSILGIYKYVTLMESGAAIILVLRWYWWRVNAWTEISALAASLIVANFLQLWSVTAPPLEGYDGMFPVRILITTVAAAIVWISVMIYTTTEPSAHVIEFYKKLRIGGNGWKRVFESLPDFQPYAHSFKNDVMAYFASLIVIFGFLYGVGQLLFGETWSGYIALGVVFMSAVYLWKALDKITVSVDEH